MLLLDPVAVKRCVVVTVNHPLIEMFSATNTCRVCVSIHQTNMTNLSQVIINLNKLIRCPQLTTVRGRKFWPIPPDYSHIELPPLEQRMLPPMEAVPNFHGRRPIKMEKRTYDMLGPELVNNYLIHGQYGVMSMSGAHFTIDNINYIRTEVGKKMDTRRMFAVWRIEPPWKPIVKRGLGKRMGGGKANIHHYATPVKAGHVIFEVAGHCEFDEVDFWMNRIANQLPCEAMAVSQQFLDDLKKEEDLKKEMNINPFILEEVIKNNMQGCRTFLSKYEKMWGGKWWIHD